MSPVKISESELLAALAEAAQGVGPDDAMTAGEIQALTGWSRDKVMQSLKLMADAGRLQAHRVKRTSIIGLIVTVPAYTVTAGPKRTRA